MSEVFNVYCDESCHLEKDRHKTMVLGAVWCPLVKSGEIAVRLREFKSRHGLNPFFEVKWTKVSPAKTRFYMDWMDYFFDDDDLNFRALVVPDKTKLRHKDFGQDHDTWHYKMHFEMLKAVLSPDSRYRIYLDIKDTRGAAKVAALHEALSNNIYDFSRKIVERVQVVRSQEVEMLQLADLLIGAVSYANRKLEGSKAKKSLVERMRSRSGYSLVSTTLLRELKVNILRWEPRETKG